MTSINRSILVAALALGAATSTAAAQDLAIERSEKPFRVGGRLGLNMARVGGDDVDDSAIKARNGFWVGGFATIRVGPGFSIEPAIGYAQKGWAVKSDLGGGTAKLDYLQAPVLAVGLIPVHAQVNLRGLAGPSISMLLSSKAKQGSQTVDLDDDTRFLDLGLVIGAGVDVALPSALLVFDLRYELGLTSVDDTSAEHEINHRVLSVNGGFAF
jgi:hypothetical protein